MVRLKKKIKIGTRQEIVKVWRFFPFSAVAYLSLSHCGGRNILVFRTLALARLIVADRGMLDYTGIPLSRSDLCSSLPWLSPARGLG